MAGDNHKTTDIGEVMSLLMSDLGAKLAGHILLQVNKRLDEFAIDNAEFCWSEADAAAKLNMSEQTLAKLAKAGQIGFSYSIKPTQWTNEARPKPQNGRRVYLRHHLLNYLRATEVKPATATGADLKFENVYPIENRRAA